MTKMRNDELLEEIKNYWAKHQHLKFGALLDRLMSLEGNIKDISYITNEEWLEWLSRADDYESFNAEILNKLRINRLKSFHSIASEKEKYGKEPNPLFIDGKFNKNNFFGGDDIIRSYFTEINENEGTVDFPEIIIDVDGTTKTVGIYAQQISNSHYINFFVTITGMELNMPTTIFDIAVFGLKKDNLDTIDFCWFNGNEMTEENYCYILNCIQATGFNFFQKLEEEEKNSTNA